MDLDNIAPHVSGWQDEVHACPGAVNIERAIKVHLPVLRVGLGDERAHVRPLDNEVDQCR